MPDQTTDLSRLAAGLTVAQRRAVSVLPDEFKVWPISIKRLTIKDLILKGLLTGRPPATGVGLTSFSWTPLGLALRAHLQGGTK